MSLVSRLRTSTVGLVALIAKNRILRAMTAAVDPW
jgi:hypothetical protein